MRPLLLAAIITTSSAYAQNPPLVNDSFEIKRSQCRNIKIELENIDYVLENDWHCDMPRNYPRACPYGRKMTIMEREAYRDRKQPLHQELMRLECGAMR